MRVPVYSLIYTERVFKTNEKNAAAASSGSHSHMRRKIIEMCL